MTCNKFTNLGHQISLKQRINCQSLDGFYTCTASYCMEILKPYSCERRCSDMMVHEPRRNLIVISGDRLLLAACQGSVLDRPSGELIWNPASDPDDIFLISCTNVRPGLIDGQLWASDCVNASLVPSNQFRDNFTLSTLMSIYYNPVVNRRLPSADLNNRQVPQESELVIYNRSRLLVNLEVVVFHGQFLLAGLHFSFIFCFSLKFCVNSLRDECKEFFAIHGRDGRDLRAPARFPCYYSPEKNDSVVTKFNRAKVVFEFALSAAVPGALFVFSCSCLVLCTRVFQFNYLFPLHSVK